MTKTDSQPVAPDAVRVWRGFSALPIDQFYSKLGAVFIPATVKMQIEAGLNSYTPSVPGGLTGKPAGVPDETAILFWESPATYWNGFTRLAVRTYTLTHGGVYVTANQASRADFPVFFSGALASNQPVFLFNKPADWMHGTIQHFVAARPDAMNPAQFHSAVASVLGEIQAKSPLDGAVACVGDDYLVYWELGPLAPGVQTPPSGIPLLQAALNAWSHVFSPAPTFLPIGLWDEWAGMDVCAGSSFNMQFERQSSR